MAPANNSVRSQAVSAAWYQGFCTALFGLTTPPDTDSTNIYYGGAGIAGYNIFLSNGVEDPWRWAGVQATLSPVEQAQVVDCPLCGHCVDLYTPTDADPAPLQAERDIVKGLVAEWLAT